MPKEKKKQKPGKEERDTRLVMWTGVCFFMFLIVFLWFLNIRNVFINVSYGEPSQFSIDKFSKEFSKAFEEAKTRMDALSQENVLGEEEKEDTLENEEGVSQGDVEALKEKLEISSTSSTSTNNEEN